MTKEYLNTAISVLKNVQSESTTNSIDSLRLITTIGVLSGIFGYLSSTELPSVTVIGLLYFILLIVGTWLINKIVAVVFRRRKYGLTFNDLITK
jgi:hypothetical protein